MKRTMYAVIGLWVFGCLLGSTAEAKRGPAPEVIPLECKGVRFTVPNTVERMGYVEAWDIGSNKKVWEKKVYFVMMNPFFEEDVQWVFIASLALNKGVLMVTDEKGRAYKVKLPSRLFASYDGRLIKISYGAEGHYSSTYNIDGRECCESANDLSLRLDEYVRNIAVPVCEFVSYNKLPPETEAHIRSAINGAGIEIAHFWVPSSIMATDDSYCPYGPGFIDLDKDKKNNAPLQQHREG